ncbi:MAG: PilZ domain-containing protein [Thermodesulfobacteriota bacterium]|nr:PilZ domain-containing protein [Thermodesulfobacteriota bacterium]
MRHVERDLRWLSKELTTLMRKIEKITKAVDKLEKAKASGRRGAKAAILSTRKAYPKKQGRGKKAAGLTATDRVINIINRAKKGVDVPTLKKKTGFEDEKVRNIVARAFKQGRVTRIGRGVYGSPKERRKHTRISSLNLVSYTCIGKDNQALGQAMGRTLDVTEGGILLETHVPMDPAHSVSLTMGVEDDLVDVKGKVVHCRPGEGKRFQSGVQFTKMNRASLQILKRFISAFKKQQHRD